MAVLARFFIWVGLAFAACVIPVPRGIWYFGPRSQWTVAIERDGLALGSSTSAGVSLGWAPLIAIKLVVLALPLLIVQRLRARKAVAGQRQAFATSAVPNLDDPAARGPGA